MRWFGWFRRHRAASDAAMQEGAPVAMIAGRKHVVGVPYMVPRDLEEMNRLDFQHYVYRQALRGNYAAPIGAPGSILDVGTGTGRWAREMAALFPQADVVGLDITHPPADEGAATELLPPNYRFAAGNVLEGLPFPDASFDFVHMRLLFAAIPHDRWPFVVGELVRVTRAGGWVESVEATPPTGSGPAMDQLMEWAEMAFNRRGVTMADGARVGERLRAAGLVNVTTHNLSLPYGKHGGRIGDMQSTNYINVTNALSGMVATYGITTIEEYNQMLAAAQTDLSSSRYKGVAPIYIAYGQRAR